MLQILLVLKEGIVVGKSLISRRPRAPRVQAKVARAHRLKAPALRLVNAQK